MACTASFSQNYREIGHLVAQALIAQPSVPTVNSPVFNINIIFTLPSFSYSFRLYTGNDPNQPTNPDVGGSFGYDIETNLRQFDGISVNYNGNIFKPIITIIFTGTNLFPDFPADKQPYLVGDKYVINLLPAFNGRNEFIGGNPALCLIRKPPNISSEAIVTPTLFQQCIGVEVPAIDINGRTLIDMSDVGNMIFTISDKYHYYKKKSIPLDIKICQLDCISPDQLKTTKFEKCCPKMVSVVKGNKQTLQKKMEVFWNETDKTVYFIPF